ncbi:MAG TPA: right-handed parallel beta-helix repeat-containing protein [Verrucomicrobiae bacterium]
MNTLLRRITFATLALVTAAAAAADFHVASNGRDEDPGTREKPFATPARAMAAVRALISAGLKSDVHVILHGGTYALGAPLVFTSADSGSADHAVTYAAASGETVVISGGRQITNWTAVGGSKWTAELAGVKSGQWFFRQLVVNDERAVRARCPNEDGVLHLATVADEVKSFTFDRPLPQESLGGQDAELVVYENWSVSRALVTSSDQRQLATATAVGWIGHGDMTTASPGKPAFIEHARAALDQTGEWFLDRGAGTLTYLAAPGEKPARTVAVAPVLAQLVKIAGTKDKPVRNLRFERLRFEHTDFPLPSTGYSEIQAAHFGPSMKQPTHAQPVAIECAYAEGIRFERCRMAHLNNSGIGFGPGCRRNAVVGCVIEDIGGNGVMIGWRGAGRLNVGAEGTLDADWMDPADAPAGNQVANCVIRRCGADSRGAVGVFVAFSADSRVAHNVIHDLPYSGVSLGYRWSTTPTSQVRCVAEYNHIYDVMKTLADGGGIYTLGFQPGTVLRGNLIHDVHRSAYAHGGAPNNGFFIDEGSKGFLFESNVVHKTSGESVRFNQCQREWHTWKGNAFDGEATAARFAAAAERAGLEPEYRASQPVPIERPAR